MLERFNLHEDCLPKGVDGDCERSLVVIRTVKIS